MKPRRLHRETIFSISSLVLGSAIGAATGAGAGSAIGAATGAGVGSALGAATGAGAAGRFNMGLVIMSGLSIGTLFTLFVVPAMYMFLAADHSKKREAEDVPDQTTGA